MLVKNGGPFLVKTDIQPPVLVLELLQPPRLSARDTEFFTCPTGHRARRDSREESRITCLCAEIPSVNRL